MIKVAITGRMGSGKSVVSRMLEIMGIPVYNCDANAKILMQEDAYIRSALTRMFGEDCYGADGTLQREWLAARIFIDKNVINQINEIVHPRVKSDFCRWAQLQNSPIVGVETAILYESGFNELVDKVLLVWTDDETAINRLQKRSSLSRKQIQNRLDNQMSTDELLMLSDYAIQNDGNTPVTPQLIEYLQLLSKGFQ